MKIALIQINPTIGDFAGNSGKIVAFAEKARQLGCRLAVFPEMALSGYPPQDLLERRSFLADHQAALEAMLPLLPDLYVLFGCFEERHSLGKHLYNSALAAYGGQIVFRARKQLLPTYDVFDESRYFEPGNGAGLLPIDGQLFGVTICEDIWYGQMPGYDRQPVAELFALAEMQGRQLTACLNISASPFERGKEATRRHILSGLAVRYRTPFLYCNQVGGQDSLLFDGRSLAVDSSGAVCAQAAGFTEDMIIVDSHDWQGDQHDPAEYQDGADVLAALSMGLADYARKCGFRQAVLGLSGGIDSALTAAIAVRALGADNVLGVALPSPYNASESLTDARLLAERLGCRFTIMPIAPLFDAFRASLAPLFAGLGEDLTEQNLQARIRGNLLMALSNKFGSLLLSTGNKSEMAVGYCTLYGDMSGGLAVIADVPKQLVYQLAELINADEEIIPRRIIDRPPSAELKPEQTDQDDLPPYPVLDAILALYLEGGESQAEIVGRGFAPEVVADILRRVRMNEYKRKQAPLALKVTSKAFGSGRRYPIAQKYQG